MPLIVLTAGQPTLPPVAPAAVRSEPPAQQAEWRQGHAAYAALSTKGVQRVLPASTHYIQQFDAPPVIQAIDDVVRKARRPR
jgi:hypothetical protein